MRPLLTTLLVSLLAISQLPAQFTPFARAIAIENDPDELSPFVGQYFGRGTGEDGFLWVVGGNLSDISNPVAKSIFARLDTDGSVAFAKVVDDDRFADPLNSESSTIPFGLDGEDFVLGLISYDELEQVLTFGFAELTSDLSEITIRSYANIPTEDAFGFPFTNEIGWSLVDNDTFTFSQLSDTASRSFELELDFSADGPASAILDPTGASGALQNNADVARAGIFRVDSGNTSNAESLILLRVDGTGSIDYAKSIRVTEAGYSMTDDEPEIIVIDGGDIAVGFTVQDAGGNESDVAIRLDETSFAIEWVARIPGDIEQAFRFAGDSVYTASFVEGTPNRIVVRRLDLISGAVTAQTAFEVDSLIGVASSDPEFVSMQVLPGGILIAIPSFLSIEGESATRTTYVTFDANLGSPTGYSRTVTGSSIPNLSSLLFSNPQSNDLILQDQRSSFNQSTLTLDFTPYIFTANFFTGEFACPGFESVPINTDTNIAALGSFSLSITDTVYTSIRTPLTPSFIEETVSVTDYTFLTTPAACINGDPIGGGGTIGLPDFLTVRIQPLSGNTFRFTFDQLPELTYSIVEYDANLNVTGTQSVADVLTQDETVLEVDLSATGNDFASIQVSDETSLP